MSFEVFDRAPDGAYAIPFQREPGVDAELEVALISPMEAAQHGAALDELTETIDWFAPAGRSFPDGRLAISGTNPSRAHVSQLLSELGSRVVVCPDPAVPALLDAWHEFIAAYRALAAELTSASQGRRTRALEEAAEERERYRKEMQQWAGTYGSGRLLQALESGERPQRIYRAERRDRDLPGFEVDADGSWHVERLRDPSQEAMQALEAVQGHLADWEIEHHECELVYIPEDREQGRWFGRPAVRITGWLGRHALIGFVPDQVDTGFGPITARYPDGVRVASGSTLRPTAYGSAYGVKHPAVQEALRHAAIVSVDMFGDCGPNETLEEYLPPDAHDLIDDELVDDFTDTIFLVGWKLGQPARLELSSLAEQIAGAIILSEAEVALDMYGDALTEAACKEAATELEQARESILGEEFVHEQLPYIAEYSLADLVPDVSGPRRTSLWAPKHPDAGDPPPRITGSDEPDWSLTDHPGITAREWVASDRERDREQRVMTDTEATQGIEQTIATLVPSAQWRAHDDDDGGTTNLIGELPDGQALLLRPPPPIAGSRHVHAWALDRYATLAAVSAEENSSEQHETLTWERLFEILPTAAHPLAVDATLLAIDRTMGWVASVGGHALSGGALGPIRECAEALNGVVAMREELEGCRLEGAVRDQRLTRHGVRHELFGEPDRMHYQARARFAIHDDRDFDQVHADFNESVYDFNPLPVSLGLELHPDGDGSLCVQCAMGVADVEEAHDLANEVISQVRWRVGLTPIDLETGEQADEIGYEIVELDMADEEDTAE
jgi:hypothetical protein